MQTIPKARYETFCRAIEKAAQLVDIEPDMDLTCSILSAYKDYLETGWTSFRTTTKPAPHRELSVRYIDVDTPHDPFAIALEKGFITDDGHPIYSLTREMQTQLPIMGYGVDLGVSHGMEKIWPFVTTSSSAEDVFALPSCPPSMKQYSDYFAQHGLKWISLYALDYHNKTMNIYFMSTAPGQQFTPEQTTAMVTDLGFDAPPDEEAQINASFGALYYTYDWESDKCTRISFAVPHQPIDNFPVHLSPVFEALMTDGPTLRDQPRGSMQTAYTANSDRNYLKIELDYSGMEFSMVAAIEAIPQ